MSRRNPQGTSSVNPQRWLERSVSPRGMKDQGFLPQEIFFPVPNISHVSYNLFPAMSAAAVKRVFLDCKNHNRRTYRWRLLLERRFEILQCVIVAPNRGMSPTKSFMRCTRNSLKAAQRAEREDEKGEVVRIRK